MMKNFCRALTAAALCLALTSAALAQDETDPPEEKPGDDKNAACEAVKNDPKIPPPPSDPVGFRLLNTQRYMEAAEYFTRTLSKNPEDIDACRGLAVALCWQKKTDEALAQFDKCIAQQPDRADIYVYRGFCLETSVPQNLDGAEADYLKALELQPQSSRIHNQLGLVYQQRHQHDKAIEYFNKAIQINPNLHEAYNNLARSLIAQGKYDEAIAMIQTAINMKPNLQRVPLYNNLGLAFLHAGRLGEAEAAFLLETAINPGLKEAHLNLGNLYVKQKRYDEAIFEYHRALLLDPNFTRAMVNIAAVYIDKGMYEDGIDKLLQAIEIDPNDPLAHYNLSRAYQLMGRVELAEIELRRAVQLGYIDGPADGSTAACPVP